MMHKENIGELPVIDGSRNSDWSDYNPVCIIVVRNGKNSEFRTEVLLEEIFDDNPQISRDAILYALIHEGSFDIVPGLAWVMVKVGDYSTEHGSPWDRGSADSWYSRGRNPHYYPNGTYNDPIVTIHDMTPSEIAAYHAGYAYNEEEGGKKVG